MLNETAIKIDELNIRSDEIEFKDPQIFLYMYRKVFGCGMLFYIDEPKGKHQKRVFRLYLCKSSASNTWILYRRPLEEIEKEFAECE